jgi:hypothetical protein
MSHHSNPVMVRASAEHCCPEVGQEVVDWEALTGFDGIGTYLPSSLKTKTYPTVVSFTYSAINGGKVYDVINDSFDGELVTYLTIKIDDKELEHDADGNHIGILGELTVEIDCQVMCEDIHFKVMWQTGGIALLPWKKTIISSVSGGCGATTISPGPSGSPTWGLGVGQQVMFTFFGGFGPWRYIRSSSDIIARVGSSLPLNAEAYEIEHENLHPELNESFDKVSDRQENMDDYKLLTEYNVALDSLPSVTIKGVKPGICWLSCTDGEVCWWALGLNVLASHCAEHQDKLPTGTTAEGKDWTGLPLKKTQIDVIGDETADDAFPEKNTLGKTFGQLLRRNEDFSIKFNKKNQDAASNWCACESQANLNVLANYKFGKHEDVLNEITSCGAFDDYDNRTTITNGGKVVTSNQQYFPASTLFNNDKAEGTKYQGTDAWSKAFMALNPITRNMACYVGQTVEIQVPDDIFKDADGNLMGWNVNILSAAAVIPTMKNDEGETDTTVKGAGWTADNTGPGMYTSNAEKKLWTITKKEKKGTIRLKALAPTNFLPTILSITPDGDGKWDDREQFMQNGVSTKFHIISIDDENDSPIDPATEEGGGSWAIRKHTEYSTDGLKTVESEKWIKVNRVTAKPDTQSTITVTQGAMLISIFSFCPPCEWDAKGHTACTFKKGEDKKDWVIPRSSDFGTFDVTAKPNFKGGLPLGHTTIKHETPGGDKGQFGNKIKFGIPHVYHKGKEPFKDAALFNDGDYSKPDEVTNTTATKKIEMNDGSTTQVGSAVVFAFGKWFAENQANNVNPIYNEIASQRGLIDDKGKWFWKGDEDGTFAQPFNDPGTLKDSLKGEMKNEWAGAYEQIRGATCMWCISEDGFTLKMPSVDLQRVLIADKNGNVKALKDNQNGKGLVGVEEDGGDIKGEPC